MDLFSCDYGVSFNYNGKPFRQSLLQTEEQVSVDEKRTAFTLSGGLKVTQIEKRKGPVAVEWLNVFENISDEDTGVISELYDLDAELPLAHEERYKSTARLPDIGGLTQLYVPVGSNLCEDEFSPFRRQVGTFDPENVLLPGREKSFSAHAGRSSCGNAPFFNIHKAGRGYFIAVGWSGQWHADLKRNSDGIRFRAGVEDARFYLKPGERLRTASMLVMPYTAELGDSFNLFRRLIKEHYSLIGRPDRAATPPVCLNLWGGMSTDDMLARLDFADRAALPNDTVWIDAGWYGRSEKPSPDEFEGDWAQYTGDWQVNPHLHPDGLKRVSEKVHASGRKLLLWFEPERARKDTPIVADHPEYFYEPVRETDADRLLNLGDERAREYCYRLLCGHIDALKIDWYRQDFNMAPLEIWRKNDAENRRGISEIKHINALYGLWDALLARYPSLMIDNCASGGRRIDIETLQRSVPLWRSDMQCPANFSEEMTQAHAARYGLWLPYTGTGTGRPCDLYRCRSAYAPALAFADYFSARDPLRSEPAEANRLHAYIEEYRRVQPYLTQDIYSLAAPCPDGSAWNVLQYHRKDDDSGVILAFRGPNAPYDTACVCLKAVSKDKSYLIWDADALKERTAAGLDLLAEGICLSLSERRTSLLLFYSAQKTARRNDASA